MKAVERSTILLHLGRPSKSRLPPGEIDISIWRQTIFEKSLRRAKILCAHSGRSEEHTSELQSHSDLVCRLLLEKKKKKKTQHTPTGNAQESYVMKSQRL